MSVKELFNPNVATVESHVDAAQAAKLMRQEHVGDLVVTEQRDGQIVPIGIITDRDIVVEIIARGADPAGIAVGDAIGRDFLTLREDNGVDHALRKMHREGVRRAPVVDASGTLVGVLSIDDVIEHLASQLGEVAGVIRQQQQTEMRRLA